MDKLNFNLVVKFYLSSFYLWKTRESGSTVNSDVRRVKHIAGATRVLLNNCNFSDMHVLV